jgi:hypothetical protein
MKGFNDSKIQGFKDSRIFCNETLDEKQMKRTKENLFFYAICLSALFVCLPEAKPETRNHVSFPGKTVTDMTSGATRSPEVSRENGDTVPTAKRIPVIYSTDLFQPPEDPDDHYDLAILASLPELDVRAVIFDMATSRRKPEEVGLGALRQISSITRQPLPPWAIGLRYPLTSEQDRAEQQPTEFQGGVELILQTLRASDEKVTLFLVGSCRDFAVAFNREPALLREKVASVYVNAGNGPGGLQSEWNVKLDPCAYLCLMRSGLPIRWCPCFSRVNLQAATPEDVRKGEAFNTYFIVPNQAKLLEKASDRLKNYFAYALNRSDDEPVSFLNQPPQPLPETPRNMWCTAPFLHAAGRKIYLQDGRYVACSPAMAEASGLTGREITVYRFDPVGITTAVDDSAQSGEAPVIQGVLDDETSPVKVFRYVEPEYNAMMISVLAELLREW